MTKRLSFLTVLAFALSLLPASAQQLTQAERDAALKHLQQTRDAFLKSIDGVSEAQWKYKPAADRWSIAEVAEHIAISESLILGLITDKVLKGPALPPNTPLASTDTMLAGLLDRSQKFQAPEFLQPATRWTSRDALTKDFIAARTKTAEYVTSTADPLHAHGAPHPVFKMLDGYQWILLLSGHSARHTAQIEEVKASAGYPKS